MRVLLRVAATLLIAIPLLLAIVLVFTLAGRRRASPRLGTKKSPALTEKRSVGRSLPARRGDCRVMPFSAGNLYPWTAIPLAGVLRLLTRTCHRALGDSRHPPPVIGLAAREPGVEPPEEAAPLPRAGSKLGAFALQLVRSVG
jgi:hypothetical protein